VELIGGGCIQIMKLLFIGDIVGRPGRHAVSKILPQLIKDESIDLVVANGENLSGGLGITKKNYDQMILAGIDLFTSGNHIFDKQEIIPFLDDKNIQIIRPANYPEKGVPGYSTHTYEIMGEKVVIANLLGRVFMGTNVESPFEIADKIVKEFPNHTIIIDFHAEATSEKQALSQHLNGRVAAVFGTHTHVATADAKITADGTAYISDVGMVGLENSILGFDPEPIVTKFLTGMPRAYEISSGRAVFNSVILETDKMGKAKSIRQLIKIVE
jgi:metallophosphoesterase (TIGR00282 family)